jgi:hypothetical protein
MANYSGSALPFASPEMAFQNTVSQGTVDLHSNRSADILLSIPNSYYAALGTVLIPPTVYVTFKVKGEEHVLKLKLDDPIPFRTLTYDHRRTSATFYDNIDKLPVRSQEQILRDSVYSKHAPETFWGLKPAL